MEVKMNARQELANYIRQLRAAKGYSLRQAGKIAGVSGGYLSDLEHCRLRIPRWKSVENIVRALDGDQDRARAIYSVIKAVTYLDNAEMTEQSERMYFEVLITTIAEIFKDFSVVTAFDVKDSHGKLWDIAFDFKRKR